MKSWILSLFLSTAIVVGLAACAAPGPTSRLPSRPNLIETSRMPVMACVFRHLGGMYPTVRKYWLDTTGAEFTWLERDFASQPPRFRYAQLDSHDPTAGDILYVRWIKNGAQTATARAGCRGQGYFAEYSLQLVNERGAWRVVSCELVCVT